MTSCSTISPRASTMRSRHAKSSALDHPPNSRGGWKTQGSIATVNARRSTPDIDRNSCADWKMCCPRRLDEIVENQRENMDDDRNDESKLVSPSAWPEIVRKIRARTPARIFVEPGAAYSTKLQLELRNDRAGAVDAVWTEF